MNWRKEGFKEGDTVYIVTKYMYEKDTIEETIVKKVGSKLLYVTLECGIDLKFSEKTLQAFCFGTYYIIYKNKEDYVDTRALEEEERNLKQEISDSISKLDIDKLRAIHDIINK